MAPSQNKSAPEFSDCTVCFVDLLGFGESVVSGSKAEGGLRDLADVLMEIDAAISSYDGSDLIFQSFSDSIYVRTKSNKPIDVMNLIVCCADLFKRLLLKGFIARGGMASGRCFSSPRIVLGEPVIRAYRLESLVAEFPRIVVGASTINLLKSEKSNEVKSFVGSYLTRKNDGPYWIDVLVPTVVQPLLDVDRNWKSLADSTDVEAAESCRLARKALLSEVKTISKFLSHRLSEISEDRKIFSYYFWLYEVAKNRFETLRAEIGKEVEIPSFDI